MKVVKVDLAFEPIGRCIVCGRPACIFYTTTKGGFWICKKHNLEFVEGKLEP